MFFQNKKLFLAAVMIAAALVGLPSKTFAQGQSVTIKLSDAPLSQLIRQAEQQTDYRFVYESHAIDISSRISVDVKNASIQTLLDKALSGTPITYTVTGNKILLSPRDSQSKWPRMIRGTVRDAAGVPVPGVAVMPEGTRSGVSTDLEGRYTIQLDRPASLLFSCLGYADKRAQVNPRSDILDVTLEEAMTALDEVVVIGYGQARKADLTGSTTSVSGEKLASKVTPNLSHALQGTMSGVQVTRSTGDPSSGSTIRVRGVTTMSTNDPLVIIDGVPGSLDTVAPEDVKDIQVLKDAASAAIYGSRAAAGVILVTTKRAKVDEFKLSYNFEYGIDRPTEVPKFASIVPWMKGLNELAYNDGAKDLYSRYSEDLINNYATLRAQDPDLYPDTDWMDLGIKKSTNHTRHALTLSGGTEKLRTIFSFNYYNAEGQYHGSDYERYSARINNDYKIADWIHASVDFSLRYAKNTNPNYVEGSVMNSFMYRSPLFNAYWSDGEFADAKDGDNSLAALYLGGTSVGRSYYVNSKVQLDLTPVKNLTLTALVAPNLYFYKGKNHRTAYELRTASGSYIVGNGFASTSVTETRNDSNNITTQFYANYRLNLGRHNITAMAGYEGYTNFWENESAWRSNYTLKNFPYLNLGPADYQYNSGTAGHNSYQSVFGRLMYSFADKYMLQANVRADGSSRFAKGYRWGTFPSVSAGWVVSQEPWFNLGPVNYLKLRASIGQLGNERIGSEFPYQAALQFGTGFIPNAATGTTDITQTAFQSTYAFEDITWETTTTYGAGLDLTMFDSRLRFTGDVYYKKTEDMLIAIGFPSYFGYNAPDGNAADMHTRGWDIELAWNDRIGDVEYGASFNLSDYRSVMGYMADKNVISGNRITEKGSYYQEWYMYQSKGIILNEAAMYDSEGNKIPVLTANDKPGCLAFVDQDGDGKITASNDRVRCGNSMPEYLYGASLWARWKGFDFNLSIQGVGHQLSYWTWPGTPFNYQAYAAPQTLIDSHWSPTATDEQNAKAKYPYLSATTTNIYAGSDFYLFNGAYMRIKDITLGYTLPASLTRKVRVNGLRLYASLNDLPAFSKYPKGYDPEWNRSGDLIQTSCLLGVNINF